MTIDEQIEKQKEDIDGLYQLQIDQMRSNVEYSCDIAALKVENRYLKNVIDILDEQIKEMNQQINDLNNAVSTIGKMTIVNRRNVKNNSVNQSLKHLWKR